MSSTDTPGSRRRSWWQRTSAAFKRPSHKKTTDDKPTTEPSQTPDIQLVTEAHEVESAGNSFKGHDVASSLRVQHVKSEVSSNTSEVESSESIRSKPWISKKLALEQGVFNDENDPSKPASQDGPSISQQNSDAHQDRHPSVAEEFKANIERLAGQNEDNRMQVDQNANN
ncbi:uncharacterized protein BYT42DRAFT_614063 [Radiomyces spectabilis]|uniref:uncharacterized protein n=1 Tax=Radiomyces spectabilis TaxID=64574 RepID=UPI00221F439B|nr:uncharacterized protein BYT42DRAFT_614063 [Radiomyces spectabilis]KAI8379798.1 hypothetical protein BYT42DRAFT_614063 [Radiomyces spectabilis]